MIVHQGRLLRFPGAGLGLPRSFCAGEICIVDVLTWTVERRMCLADLAESGRRHAAPLVAERIWARGEQRLRRRRAALASGGALPAAALAVGGLSPTRAPQVPEPPAVIPTSTASLFVRLRSRAFPAPHVPAGKTQVRRAT